MSLLISVQFKNDCLVSYILRQALFYLVLWLVVVCSCVSLFLCRVQSQDLFKRQIVSWRSSGRSTVLKVTKMVWIPPNDMNTVEMMGTSLSSISVLCRNLLGGTGQWQPVRVACKIKNVSIQVFWLSYVFIFWWLW